MPGLHLIIRKHFNGSVHHRNKWVRIAPFFYHSQDYSHKALKDDGPLWIGFTGYENYPVEFEEIFEGFIIVEGHIYNKQKHTWKQELLELCRKLYNAKEPLRIIKPWVLSADGDFIIAIFDKQRKQLCIFNDAMGRLPVYLCHFEDQLLISREVKFITANLPDYEYDNLGIAETLVFGYTLGSSTMIKGVHRLDGGVLLSVDLASLTVKIDRTYEFNLDKLLDNPEKPVKEHAASLADLFLNACNNIKTSFPAYTHVVSLSGGFDSRSVLAGMKRVNAKVSAFSFDDTGTDSHGRDAPYAAQVAHLLGVEWQRWERPPNSISEMELLLWFKDGLNHAGMAFLLPLHRRLKNFFGPEVIHLTGDNGDRSMDPQGPPIKFNNFDHYCKFIIERHTRIKLDDAADITGLPRRDLEENLRQKLIRYPEINLENCYRHFILAERLFNWNFQAEDRNRIYLWHATPFSCFSYFEYAMSVNDRVKKYWRLFEEFLRLLDQRCLSVHYANWKAPITSYLRYLNPFKQSLYERLPASLRIIIRDNILYRGLKVEESWRQYLDQCLTNLDYHARFINVDKTSAYTKNCNINSFDNILTFIAYMKLHDDKIARIKALKVDENINI